MTMPKGEFVALYTLAARYAGVHLPNEAELDEYYKDFLQAPAGHDTITFEKVIDGELIWSSTSYEEVNDFPSPVEA